jgi:hypothetical protein
MADKLLRLRLKINDVHYTGRIWADELKKTMEQITDAVLPGYLVARLQLSQEPEVDIDINFDNGPELARSKLVQTVRDATTPVIRTPLTIANIHKWAVDCVAKVPTREESQWDDKAKKHIKVEVPTTPEWYLAQLLLARDQRSFSDYSKCELFESAMTWAYQGVKGYKDYSKDELLTEIWDELCDPDQSPFAELNDLEDLLEQLGYGEE